MGYFTTASGDYSIAMGVSTTASGYNSTAMVNSSKALGVNSIAMGQFSLSDTMTGVGVGGAIAIGNKAYAGGDINFAIGAHTANPNTLATSTSNNNKFVILQNGYVGIGTESPLCPLEIGTAPPVYVTGSTFNSFYWYNNAQTGTATNRNLSIKVAGAIWSDGNLGFIATSDSRVKQNIVEVNDGLALQQLRAIEVKSYDYIDKNEYGEEETIGFIAQQVKTVIPQAIQIRGKYLPDEMREINVVYEPFETTDKHNKEITKYKFTINNLSGTKYKFKVMSEEDRILKTIELEKGEDGKFTCDNQYENVYIYGKWVDDFHTLVKSKLFTTNFAASQEIDRIQQQEKTKLAALETENAQLKTRLTAIELRLSALES